MLKRLRAEILCRLEFYRTAIKYFNKFIEIKEYCNTDWSHWDLLYVRESKQLRILNSSINLDFQRFINQQLEISKQVINAVAPKIIVVCNTMARDILKNKENPCGYNVLFDNEIGTYRIKDDSTLNNVPIFFSGMLTGQRALDIGSFERLKWHINWVLSKI